MGGRVVALLWVKHQQSFSLLLQAESEGRVEELAAAYAKSELTGMMGAVVDDLLQKSPDSSEWGWG